MSCSYNAPIYMVFKFLPCRMRWRQSGLLTCAGQGSLLQRTGFRIPDFNLNLSHRGQGQNQHQVSTRLQCAASIRGAAGLSGTATFLRLSSEERGAMSVFAIKRNRLRPRRLVRLEKV